MEKFFEVKGSTPEMLEKVILKVGVIPVLIVVLPTILLGRICEAAAVSGIAIAAIYLFVFYFKARANK